MTFKKNFVAVIKSKGQILREQGDTVSIPFGEEYTILLKNLEARRALVKIDIDGKDIGNRLIVQPNSTVELERFINELNSGHKLKFIQKTKQIVDHRGDRVDDGIIRIEVIFEQQQPPICTSWYYPTYGPTYRSYKSTDVYGATGTIGSCTSSGITKGTTSAGIPDYEFANCASQESLNSASFTSSCNFCSEVPTPNVDEGITVKGSISNQSFQYGYIGALENVSTIITLKLTGRKGNEVFIQKPVAVTTKFVCETCGQVSKSSKKFCSNCGTSLI